MDPNPKDNAGIGVQMAREREGGCGGGNRFEGRQGDLGKQNLKITQDIIMRTYNIAFAY